MFPFSWKHRANTTHTHCAGGDSPRSWGFLEWIFIIADECAHCKAGDTKWDVWVAACLLGRRNTFEKDRRVVHLWFYLKRVNASNLLESFLCGITSHQRTGPSLSSLAPSGWHVTCCCCAILKRGKKNRGMKFPRQPPASSTLTFFSLYVTITLLQMEKEIESLHCLEDEIISLTTTDTIISGLFIMVPERALVYI